MTAEWADREAMLATGGVLAGGGDMGEAMRAFDWPSTSLGPVEGWPQALKTCVRIMLTSQQPMFVWWGDELINLYNDAYRDILGGKHPWALGRPAAVVWREIWDQVGPRAHSAMQGNEGTYDEALLLIMERNGYPEETYYTFSYSPVPNDAGGTGGILCANTNDTQRIIGERQLALLRELAAATADSRTIEDSCRLSSRALETNLRDLPFALIYLLDRENNIARLAGRSNMPAGHPAAPETVSLHAGSLWRLGDVVRSNEPVVIPRIPPWVGDLPHGAWDRPPETAVALPIAASGETGQAGVLVAGLNPYRLFDADYSRFLGLVAGQISGAFANAQAYEEERKRADALAELDRAKTVFFSNVSHEFRTPLTLLLGPLEDALAGDGGIPAAQREELEVAHRNALRLLRLVNSLLDFSRIEAGRITASYTPTDLPAYTADLASTFRSATERAGIRLLIDCPPLPAGMSTYVDRDMWEKILLNLLSNAFKFTFEGEIAVRLRPAESGGAVQLQVSDTGTGIPASELPRLFERFHRVQGAEARTHEGTGIGLALVQELARLHGGNVAVESELGTGTTFTVTIPVGKQHLPAEHIATVPGTATDGSGAAAYVQEALRWLPGNEQDDWADMDPNEDLGSVSDVAVGPVATDRPRVLLADDNSDMREYVARLLRTQYEVEPVADGQAALEAARRNRPDLVLSDVMMPRLDGFGLLHALRKDVQTRDVPVILLSARAGEEARVEGLDAGADDYLVKPFAARELLARVGSHIALNRVRAESALREQQARQTLEKEIAAHSRARALLTGERAILETIARGLPLSDTLEALAHFIEARSKSALCSILLLDGDRLRHGAAPSLPEAYNAAIDGLATGPAVGSCGTAAFRGEPVVVSDIANDPLWADFKELAAEHGLGACWSTPIRGSAGEILGTFALYHREPVAPTDEERELVSVLTYLAGIAIERHRSETERGRILERERAAREEAEAAVRVRDEFLSIASHELRTPATVIKGVTQLWQRSERKGRLTPERLAQHVETIQRAGDRLSILISDLLDVSRLQSGQFSLRLEPLDLREVVQEIVARHMEQLETRDLVRIDLRLPSEPVLVDADSTRLEQVLDNLLSNAVKYSPGKSSIEVSLSTDGMDATIVVQDHGIGLPAGTANRIFEPFGRAENAVQKNLPGMGLGLYICRHIAQLHQGTLWAESPGEDQGTAMYFRLPVRGTTPIPTPTPQRRAGLQPGDTP